MASGSVSCHTETHPQVCEMTPQLEVCVCVCVWGQSMTRHACELSWRNVLLSQPWGCSLVTFEPLKHTHTNSYNVTSHLCSLMHGFMASQVSSLSHHGVFVCV